MRHTQGPQAGFQSISLFNWTNARNPIESHGHTHSLGTHILVHGVVCFETVIPRVGYLFFAHERPELLNSLRK